MGARKTGVHWLIMLLLILLGIFLGNSLGILLADIVPFLAEAASVGFEPIGLGLAGVLSLTIGLSMYVNVVGALGGILAFIILRRF